MFNAQGGGGQPINPFAVMQKMQALQDPRTRHMAAAELAMTMGGPPPAGLEKSIMDNQSPQVGTQPQPNMVDPMPAQQPQVAQAQMPGMIPMKKDIPAPVNNAGGMQAAQDQYMKMMGGGYV